MNIQKMHDSSQSESEQKCLKFGSCDIRVLDS